MNILNESVHCVQLTSYSNVQSVDTGLNEYVEVTDQGLVTMKCSGCRTTHFCQMHLSIVAPQLKEISVSVGGLLFYQNGFLYLKPCFFFFNLCFIGFSCCGLVVSTTLMMMQQRVIVVVGRLFVGVLPSPYWKVAN